MKRIAFSVLLALGLLSASWLAAVAQPTETESTFTSGLAGDVIDLGNSGEIVFLPEAYELNRRSLVAEEYVWFTYGLSNFELVLIEGELTTSDYFDLTIGNMMEFYDSFEILEQRVVEDHAWFVANAVFEGTPLVVFYDFQLDAVGDLDLVVMQFTDAEQLAADMEFVQSEVSVGGNALLPDTNAQAVQSLVTGEVASATPERATAEAATVHPRIAEPGNSTETTTPDVGDLIADATPQSDGIAGTAVAGGDWETMGLVSGTEWVSPSFGVSVEWDAATWVFPIDYEYAIYLNDDPVYDVVTIETTDGLGYAFVTVENTGGNTPISLAGYWASPEYADTFEATMTVVETATTRTTASVVYETVNAREQPLYVVLTATFLDDGTVVYSQISAAPDTIHVVYGHYVDGVQVNGEPINLTYTVDDIAEISGN